MSFEHGPLLNGRTVIDARLAPVGTITDVIPDEHNDEADWAVVKTGALSGGHYMPLGDSYVDDAGRLVVPFDKASVKRAPKAGREHVLTPDLARELRAYYGRAA
jgi:hypothetical protein